MMEILPKYREYEFLKLMARFERTKNLADEAKSHLKELEEDLTELRSKVFEFVLYYSGMTPYPGGRPLLIGKIKLKEGRNSIEIDEDRNLTFDYDIDQKTMHYINVERPQKIFQNQSKSES